MGVLPTCKRKRLQKYRYAGAFALHGMALRLPLIPVSATTKIVAHAIKVYQVQLQLEVSSVLRPAHIIMRASAQSLLRSLKQCSADREYTYWATLAQYAKTQSRTNASDIAHFVGIV